MDDVIQLLVFVITFIVFIVSAIIKQKKKPGAKSSNFESMIESFFGVQKPTQKQTPIAHEEYFETKHDLFEDSTKSDGFKKIKKDTEPSYFEEGIDTIPDHDKDNNVSNQSDTESDESIFDIRQDVIYSEILNRKSY